MDVPVVKEIDREKEEEEELCGPEARAFRGLAARANYLSADRPDIQYGAKEACRDMARPTRASMARLKRLARYLLRHPRVVIRFRADPFEEDHIAIYSDSDWAGCLRTRRSTSGGIAVVGGGVVKSWSSTQPTVALSSGEAEYVAAVKAGAEGLGLVALMRDLGWRPSLTVWLDSSAAKSMASRMGLGRLRHVEVKELWLQQAVRSKRLELRTVRGAVNPADWLTKPHSLPSIRAAMAWWGIEVDVGVDGEEEVGKRRRWADLAEEEEEEEEGVLDEPVSGVGE